MTEFRIHTYTAAERVTFTSDGIDLVGELRPPPGDEPAPAVALTGPFTGVKDQVAGAYAERLAQAGLVTLAFDHRGFGESGGRRGHEDSQGKLADLRAAVELLRSRPEVDPDRIGLVGVCLGGGYAVRAAAENPQVKAVVGIAGGYNSPAWIAERMGIDAYRSAFAGFLDARCPAGLSGRRHSCRRPARRSLIRDCQISDRLAGLAAQSSVGTCPASTCGRAPVSLVQACGHCR
ncbi:alpha/beta fold hydrolase [Micromonospora sp. NPDC048909]|uniref:alpha/beta hydrolase n=1 Tax=Micromonospora sp. NPDC048909 TaxID=3155643 RepID=UPI0034020FC7